MKPRKLLKMSILYINFVLGPTQRLSFSKIPHWKMRLRKNQKNRMKVPAKSLRIVLPVHQKKTPMKDRREILSMELRDTAEESQEGSSEGEKDSNEESEEVSTNEYEEEFSARIWGDIYPPRSLRGYQREY